MPSEDQRTGPTYFYGPNGEAEIFQPADEVPEGWADSPAAAKPKGDAPALTRKQIMSDLTERKVEFDVTSSNKVLYDLLVDAIDKTA